MQIFILNFALGVLDCALWELWDLSVAYAYDKSWNFDDDLSSELNHWASSTGLTAVSKIKPRLPAQWAVGTHRKGPSQMEKVTSKMNWPIIKRLKFEIKFRL